jgi:hypothetical protein
MLNSMSSQWITTRRRTPVSMSSQWITTRRPRRARPAPPPEDPPVDRRRSTGSMPTTSHHPRRRSLGGLPDSTTVDEASTAYTKHIKAVLDESTTPDDRFDAFVNVLLTIEYAPQLWKRILRYQTRLLDMALRTRNGTMPNKYFAVHLLILLEKQNSSTLTPYFHRIHDLYDEVRGDRRVPKPHKETIRTLMGRLNTTRNTSLNHVR